LANSAGAASRIDHPYRVLRGCEEIAKPVHPRRRLRGGKLPWGRTVEIHSPALRPPPSVVRASALMRSTMPAYDRHQLVPLSGARSTGFGSTRHAWSAMEAWRRSACPCSRACRALVQQSCFNLRHGRTHRLSGTGSMRSSASRG
jgi:hypothetical protein